MFPSSSTIKPPTISDIKRPTAHFHPSIWKDRFLLLASHELEVGHEMETQAQHLKEEVRKMLIALVPNPLEKLRLVDSIQRLGVSYHFQNEIDQVLQQIHAAYISDLSSNDDHHKDLDTSSLLFRLIRQQGYKISCDIFAKFTESNGKFKELLGSDARGMLSLYEAAHMRVHGEDVLDEALDFSVKHLQRIVATSAHPLATEVSNALKWPLRKALPRIKAREYMVTYEDDPSHDETLLTFSKLDFNILQKLHQKELIEFTRWWNDLEFTTKLSFARDRLVEGYFWVLGMYYEPQFHTARMITSKVFAMASILDDLYDAYATYEELKLLTYAIQRWDISMINEIPEYMKVYYKTLLDVYEESEKELTTNNGRSFHIQFGKEKMKEQVGFYMAEAEWLHKGQRPTLEEYLEVVLETSGGSFFTITSFIGMGEVVTKDTFEWVRKNPKIITASNVIARFLNDISSHEFEKKREHIISVVESYMQKYGCSRDEACIELRKEVEDAWKDVNEACLIPTEIPSVLLQLILNFCRAVHFIYLDENDGYTHSSGTTKTYVQSLLIDPMPF